MATESENSPLSLEPLTKKPKMSTTSNSDDEDTDAAIATGVLPSADAPKKPRYKRRKVAIFFAYCGVGYQGMQKNPGAKTIEGDLEEALFHAGAVPEQDRGQPKRFEWARSARTDKGVSAVGQVVSGRFYVDPPGFVERLQSNLPSQIRIFGYKRATASFHAKKFVDRRRYVYLLPVFALDPSCHRDRESVMASVGSGSELLKCLECSERGRKVVGLMGNKESRMNCAHESDVLVNGSGILSNSVTSLMEVDIEATATDADRKNLYVDDNLEKRVHDAEEAKKEEPNPDLSNDNGEDTVEKEKRREFSYGEQVKEKFCRILKHYEGTHNFHNFTTRTKAEDPSARRYIVSFEANSTITIDGIEFVKCEVIGQSFMLHQIRKMIGLAVAVMRNIAPESIYDTAFYQSVNINVPTAPEVGLYLDECFFTSYNNRWKSSHEELSMKSYAEEAEEFKRKYIYPHIAETEHKDGVVGLWLHSLNHRNYPDLLANKKNDASTVMKDDDALTAMKDDDALTAMKDDDAETVNVTDAAKSNLTDAAKSNLTDAAISIDAETAKPNNDNARDASNVKDDSTISLLDDGNSSRVDS